MKPKTTTEQKSNNKTRAFPKPSNRNIINSESGNIFDGTTRPSVLEPKGRKNNIIINNEDNPFNFENRNNPFGFKNRNKLPGF